MPKLEGNEAKEQVDYITINNPFLAPISCHLGRSFNCFSPFHLQGGKESHLPLFM